MARCGSAICLRPPDDHHLQGSTGFIAGAEPADGPSFVLGSDGAGDLDGDHYLKNFTIC
jgi:hypothetical protein